MRRFPGSGPGLSAPPCRVLPSAVGLLSMNIQRPLPTSSSSSSALYVSPWLRLFLLSGFLSLSLAHTYTPSLFHCIHFWAFKKSSRITNQPEWQRRVKDYKRKLNEDGADQAFFFYYFYFLFLLLFPPYFSSILLIFSFKHASEALLKDDSDGLGRI